MPEKKKFRIKQKNRKDYFQPYKKMMKVCFFFNSVDSVIPSKKFSFKGKTI